MPEKFVHWSKKCYNPPKKNPVSLLPPENSNHCHPMEVGRRKNKWVFTIIIMSLCEHGFPWLSFSLSLSRFSSIIHRFRQIFYTISCVCPELLLISFCWLANTCTSVSKGRSEKVTQEFVFTPSAVSCMTWLVGLLGFMAYLPLLVI